MPPTPVTLACTVLLIAMATSASARDFVLVRDGKPAATIVVAERPTVSAQFAVDELQNHIGLITGASLPVVNETEAASGPRVLVGESAATRALGLRSTDFATQEHLIRFEGDTLILMGRDDPEHGFDGPHDPAWTEGRFGGALQFDGVDDVFVVPDPGFSDDEGTLEAWVWLPAESDDRPGTILRLDGQYPWTYHIIQREPNSNTITYTTYDGSNGYRVASQELAEGWHHVAATYSQAEGRMELFIDGQSQGVAGLGSTTCRTAQLNVGGLAVTPPANLFRGRIDEIRISTVVRTPSLACPPPDDHTALYLPLDEAGGRPRDASFYYRTTGGWPGLFSEHGTLNAVYDFLERLCGVRWYIPTEIGTTYTPRPTLAVEAKGLRRTPAMIHRWITPTPLYVPTRSDPVPSADAELWKLRMRIGGQAFWVCHSFEGYYDRFLSDHPEWFAQGYSGRPPQMCFSNEGFIAQAVADARRYFDGGGAPPGATAAGDVFGLVPMDNMSWCKCDACQAALDASEMGNPQFSNGIASDYVFGFVNRVAAEVYKTHPDKWIGALAYSDYAYYPTRVELMPNIVVQMCLHTRNWWVPSMEANDLRVFDAWVAREGDRRPLYLWLYYNFPAYNGTYGDFNAFPGFFAHTAVKQMARYHAAGIRGIFMEHSSEFEQSHLLDVPDMYVTLKLSDDPSLDGDALIDEFFTRYYGSAADPMRRLYRRIEETFSSPANYPDSIRLSPAHHHQDEELAWGYLGTDERMAEFAALMSEASRAARTELEQKRVELFERGVWWYMREGKRKYEARRSQG